MAYSLYAPRPGVDEVEFQVPFTVAVPLLAVSSNKLVSSFCVAKPSVANHKAVCFRSAYSSSGCCGHTK